MFITEDKGYGTNLGAVLLGHVHNFKFQVTKGMTDGVQTSVDFILLDTDIDLAGQKVVSYSGDLFDPNPEFQVQDAVGPTPMIALSHGVLYVDNSAINKEPEETAEVKVMEADTVNANGRSYSPEVLDQVPTTEDDNKEESPEKEMLDEFLLTIGEDGEVYYDGRIVNLEEENHLIPENANITPGWKVFTQIPSFEDTNAIAEYYLDFFNILKMCINDTELTDMKPEFPEIDINAEDVKETVYHIETSTEQIEINNEHFSSKFTATKGYNDDKLEFFKAELDIQYDENNSIPGVAHIEIANGTTYEDGEENVYENTMSMQTSFQDDNEETILNALKEKMFEKIQEYNEGNDEPLGLMFQIM